MPSQIPEATRVAVKMPKISTCQLWGRSDEYNANITVMIWTKSRFTLTFNLGLYDPIISSGQI